MFAESTPSPAEPTRFTGHTMVDEHGKTIGKISDVIYASEPAVNTPRWLVVDVGLFGSSHYVPAEQAFLAETGEVVATVDKHLVKTAPKASREHIVNRELEAKIAQHYALSS